MSENKNEGGPARQMKKLILLCLILGGCCAHREKGKLITTDGITYSDY